jgi:DNA-binding Lrp family transcriptional regulator
MGVHCRTPDTAGINIEAGVNGVVEAFMLIQTEVGRAEVVAKQVAALPGVLSSEYVTGPYDVVVRVGSESMGTLQADVVASVQAVDGITRTLTCPIADGPTSD